MKRFLLKSALFLAPVALFMAVVALIDPYGRFSGPLQQPLTYRQSLKDSVGGWNDNALYKFIRYDRNPSPNIILGDSRMYSLDSAAIDSVSGEAYFNFAIQGASFREIADAFWFAAGRTKLRRAYIGINFLLFNESNRKDRTSGAKAILRNPLLYFCNWTVLKASGDLVKAARNGGGDPGRVKMDKERFWKYVLYEETVPGYLNKYVYPESFVAELKRMAEYARANAIDLRFVIPPTHVDLQKRVAEMGFAETEARFKAQLRELAPTYDFELENPVTADAANFKDPMHYNAAVGERLVREIWGRQAITGLYSVPKSQTESRGVIPDPAGASRAIKP